MYCLEQINDDDDDDDDYIDTAYLIIRPHRSTTCTWMRPTVTDGVAWSVVGLSVGLHVTIVSPAKTAEPIKMPFGMWTRVGPRKPVLKGVAHWCHLLNATEPSMFDNLLSMISVR